ncbi:hypothetical protein SB778_13650, partial [Paraburkholderia sp. SIMBA_050]
MTHRDPPASAAARYDAYLTRLSAAPEEHDLFNALRWLDALTLLCQEAGVESARSARMSGYSSRT